MPYNFVGDRFHTGVTAEALRAKIDRKSAISHQRGHFDPKFQVQGVAPPPIVFAHLVRPTRPTPYNFAADSFHTKKLCCRLSSSEVHFLMKIGRFAFLRPPLGDLGATYDDRLRLIGKRVVDFLLALIELFSLGVTAEELRAIIGLKSAISLQWGSVEPNFT